MIFIKLEKTEEMCHQRTAYECKRCSIKRVTEGRKKKEIVEIYPDW